MKNHFTKENVVLHQSAILDPLRFFFSFSNSKVNSERCCVCECVEENFFDSLSYRR